MDVNAKQKNGKMHMKTTVMDSFQYYSWYSIFIFIFVSLIIICVVFCNYVHIMWELYVQRVEGANVKTHCEYNNDPIKNMFWM
jgi:hypothetical protein